MGTMDPKNVVQVQIFGHSYTIKSEADQEHVRHGQGDRKSLRLQLPCYREG